MAMTVSGASAQAVATREGRPSFVGLMRGE